MRACACVCACVCVHTYTHAQHGPCGMLCGLRRRGHLGGRMDERMLWSPAGRLNSNNSLRPNALTFAKIFHVHYLLGPATTSPVGDVIFFNLNMKKTQPQKG